MKKQLLSLMMILLPMVANADAVEKDGLFYNLNYETKEASIISAGDNCRGNIVIPSGVEINGQSFNVISIEDRAFKGCKELTSIIISNGLYSIGDNAFENCYELTSISFPSSFAILGNNVFVDCWNLKSVNVSDLESWCKVSFPSPPFYEHQLYINGSEIKDLVIPEGVTKINKYVFSRCTNVQTLTMPNSVKEIGEGAFYKCDSLESILLSNSTEIIRECAFEGCANLKSVSIPNSLTSIENRAFYGCKKLVSAPIPNGVMTIGDRAFYGCKSLTTIEIPDGVATIGEWAFYGCDGFSSLFIPNSVTSIGVAAFSGCNGIMSIKVSDGNMVYDSRNNCNAIIETESNTMLIGCNNSLIPNSIQFIGGSAFYGCNELKTIEIPNTVTKIGGNAFTGSGLVSIDIPNSVKDILSGVFSGCNSLTSIKLPNSISSIEEGTFSYCSSLTSVEIPNSVKIIGSYAFRGCNKLESIELPNCVTRIGEWAFENCDALITIKIPKGIEELSNYIFYNCNNLQFVYLPSSLKTIGSAFEDCLALSDVYCFAEDVPSVDSHSLYFPVIDNYTTLHVSASSIDKYKSASIWNKFGSIVALTDEELKMYDDDNYGSTVNPVPDGVIEGVYLLQLESYRINNGNKQTYDRVFDILITDNGDGSYHVNDLLGGWYQRYGINYAMTGNIVIAADGTVSLKDSYIAGWGDSLVGLTGSYDASTSSFTIEAEYVEGMKFFQTWVKDYKVFTVDGIYYRIGENFTVSVIKGYYSGDIVIPEIVSYNGVTYSVTSIDEKAFRWCTDITSVIIPNSVTSLGQRAFEGCKNLLFVTIPNSVTYIDESAFNECI